MVFLRSMYIRTPIIAQLFLTHRAGSSANLARPARGGVRQLSGTGSGSFAGSIYSLSSGQGKCGVAVIRVSGPEASTALKELGRFVRLPGPRRAVLRRLWHPTTTRLIDRGLVIWFPGPASFTGEDSCELHVHGGLAVVAATLQALGAIPGLRHAEPGEFTKRAFQNGKLDLTEVEGLADLIAAETELQHRQAVRQMEGDLRTLYAGWRQQLLKCVASLEAYIDFSENDNLEDGILEQVFNDVQLLTSEIERHLADNRRGEILRSGVRVAIIGEPNVGKSSLLNLLCQCPAAIVSREPGTTRDVIEKTISVAGCPVILSDTAGLRQSDSPVETEGVRRALESAHSADLNILVLDASDDRIHQHQSCLWTFAVENLRKLGFCDISKDARCTNTAVETAAGHESLLSRENTLVVINKSDLLENSCQFGFAGDLDLPCCHMSCVTQDGLDVFLHLLEDKVKLICGDPASGPPSLTQARHRTELQACNAALHRSTQHHPHDVVLSAHHLHAALTHIGKVTGHVTSDELLNVIFRDFCIGK